MPKLLDCLERQTFDDFEVIVADADSTDRTAEIAREYGAKVVPGGMPAEGRNSGAEAAQGDYYFFFDADVKFNRHFLARAYNEMQSRFIDVATCEAHPLSNVPLDRLMHNFANVYARLSQYTSPKAPGYCILIHSRLFHRVGGFDTDVTHAEDFDLIRRAAELRPFRILDSVHVNVSVRRYRKEGRLAFIGHSLGVSLHRTFRGEIRDDFEYEFGNFEKSEKNAQLRRIERGINKLTRRLRRASKAKKSTDDAPDEEQDAALRSMQTQLKELYDRLWDDDSKDG